MSGTASATCQAMESSCTADCFTLPQTHTSVWYTCSSLHPSLGYVPQLLALLHHTVVNLPVLSAGRGASHRCGEMMQLAWPYPCIIVMLLLLLFLFFNLPKKIKLFVVVVVVAMTWNAQHTVSRHIPEPIYSIRYYQQNNYQQRQKNTAEFLQNLRQVTPWILLIPAWFPHYKKDKQLLERVQHRFTRMLPGLKSLEYDDRLKAFGNWSLEERRNRADLLEVFKMKSKWHFCSFIWYLLHSWQQRAPLWKIVKHCSNLDVWKYFFSERVVDRWNKLDRRDIDCGSINGFN